MTRKNLTASRLARNLSRMVRSCTPPILEKILFPKKANAGPVPPANESVAQCSVPFIIPAVPPTELWPGFEQTEVKMIPGQIRNHLWAMPENELLVLSVISRLLAPRRVFEFGTFTGASTLAIAANTDPQTRIMTLDINPENRRSHRTGVGSDIPFDYVIGESFLKTRWNSKIERLYSDARNFDTKPYEGKMDLVFVDADHTYPFVRNDTEKALQMLAPGGVILWHDYRWDDDTPECQGVTRLVNQFHDSVGECREIAGTRFAIFQSDANFRWQRQDSPGSSGPHPLAFDDQSGSREAA